VAPVGPALLVETGVDAEEKGEGAGKEENGEESEFHALRIGTNLD
jgi:hypothetical protein